MIDMLSHFLARRLAFYSFIMQAVFLFFSATSVFSQTDTVAIKILYDRALEFDESRLDSFDVYISMIDKSSAKLKYSTGELLSTRLKGIKAELSGDYQTAITHYLYGLEKSRQLHLTKYESSAVSDLGMVYTNIKNPAKAKEYFLEAVAISEKHGEPSANISNLSNLGAICNQLEQTDSALFYFEKAQKIADTYEGKIDLTFLRNNFGNAWFRKKEWNKALPYFRMNFVENMARNDKTQLWYDVLNMGDVFIELKRYDSAKTYLDVAYQLALDLDSKRKKADVDALFAKYYARQKQYMKAYESLQEWNSIDTSLVNEETRETIIEMEERFHAKQREQQNKLLLTQFEAEKLKAHQLFQLSLAIAGIALTAGVFLILIRKKNKKLHEKNELIQMQNKKLAELNMEKNSLISIVSHDLSTPFASIRMWNQLLESNRTTLSDEQLKAVDRIKSSLDSGEALIRNILLVEKEEVNQRSIHLEELNLLDVLQESVDEQSVIAEKKEIHLFLEVKNDQTVVLTDHQLIKRVFDNLISNAIKFSPRGKNIFIETGTNVKRTWVSIRDEGPGISQSEIKNLFNKYAKASARPTGGELSTGLGLSIVKRIMEELGGEVICESEEGKGSVFTVFL